MKGRGGGGGTSSTIIVVAAAATVANAIIIAVVGRIIAIQEKAGSHENEEKEEGRRVGQGSNVRGVCMGMEERWGRGYVLRKMASEDGGFQGDNGGGIGTWAVGFPFFPLFPTQSPRYLLSSLFHWDFLKS